MPGGAPQAGPVTEAARAVSEGRIASACLLLAAARHPGISLSRYDSHLARLGADAAAHHAAAREDSAAARLAALRHALAAVHGYRADPAPENSLETADLIRAIDTRAACPLALALLGLAAARACGWEAAVLDVAGAPVLRLMREGRPLLCDPVDGWDELQASGLRRLVKARLGPRAELSAAYYEPVADAALPVMLENLIKLRLIEDGAYEEAYRLVARLRLLRPGEYRLLLDAGVLAARTGRYPEAAAALESYIAAAPGARDRQEAALLLREVRAHL
jgi:regulator of sirC expression with transglutaminase-like and TPR domain